MRNKLHIIGIQLSKHSKWLIIVSPALALINLSFDAFAATYDHWAISSQFNEVGGVYTAKPHNGIDFPVPENTPVLSVTDGKVVGVYDEGHVSFGKSVHVLDPQGREVIYGHLSKFECQPGDIVHVGQEVARSGNTGFSTGAHCHIQININGKPIDPMPTLIKADEQIQNMR